MLIHNAEVTGSLKINNVPFNSGSFSGSFRGDGSQLTGVTGATTASYVEYSNVGNKPTLVSGSSQITYSGLSGIPSGIVSGSEQVSFNGIVDKPTLVSGSSQITYSGLTGIPSGIVSGSSQVSYTGLSNIPSGIVSSSTQITGYNIFATTGSNTFQGNQTITGSLFVAQNLVVAGSSSIQYISSSVVDIADNIITVNAFNPGVRFGGLAVADSGSSPRVSGSILFDSIKDQWIFVHEQPTITSSVVLMGPETYNDLGNETYLSANRLPKGSGIEHLRDSNITDTGTVVSVNSNTTITGSFTVITGSAVELQVTNTGVNIGNALIDSHIISGSLRVNPNGLFVSGSGNVGIGTASPSWKLQVETTDITAALFRSNAASTILGIDNSAADGDPQLKFYINDVGTFTLGVDDSDGDKFKIGTSDLTTNTRLTIDGSGNVGIGTNIPEELLDIRGANRDETSAQYNQVIYSTSTHGINRGGSIGLGGTTNGTSSITAFGAIKGGKENDTSGNTAGALLFLTRVNAGPITEKMRITSTGTVQPGANGTQDLGSTSFAWANIYTNDLHLSNMGKEGGNDIDGTSGTWTIQEGAEDLYIINNINNKKFRIKLEEII